MCDLLLLRWKSLSFEVVHIALVFLGFKPIKGNSMNFGCSAYAAESDLPYTTPLNQSMAGPLIIIPYIKKLHISLVAKNVVAWADSYGYFTEKEFIDAVDNAIVALQKFKKKRATFETADTEDGPQ